jgi:hypothetical protein
MRHLLMRVALAAIVATIIGPVRAQVPQTAAVLPQQPPPAYYGFDNVYHPYPFPAPTPEDAYRDGLINRWQLEQFVGPTPPALQGPSPNGRGGDGGSGDRGG